MKLEKTLEINGKSYPVIDENITIELSAVGRAIFKIESDSIPEKGLVQFSIGYSDDELYSFFIGTVEKVTPISTSEVILICRELSSVLDSEEKLALRHVSVVDILQAIEEKTELSFLVPEGVSYTNVRTPFFYNMSTLRHAVEALAKLFGVEKTIWTQLPDGQIYWGSWNDSLFSEKEVLEIPEEIILKHNPEDRSFQIPVIPALRTGSLLSINNEKLIVDSVIIESEIMRLRYLSF
jgi:hypothetical protein